MKSDFSVSLCPKSKRSKWTKSLTINENENFIILCNPKLGLGFLIPSIFIIQSPVPKGLKEEMKLNLTRSDILQGHARFKS